MAGCGCGTIFGASSSQYIKVNGGDFVAIDGSDTLDKVTVSDLRMPYAQLLKSRVKLKSGQVNYLLNYLGLGDNVTFLLIKAVYDNQSVIEEDNYITWSFYDDLSKVYSIAQMMCLTGNSTNRIKQIYLNNPSTKYGVTLDVMVGIIDDTYTFFSDTLNQSGTSFTGLEYTDIETYVVGESLVINDKSSPVRPLLYLTLNNINSIEISGKILSIDDSSRSTIFLQFLTEYDANQVNSLISYIMENPSTNIDSLVPLADTTAPVVYFLNRVGGGGDDIRSNGNSSGPYNTGDGLTFSTSISISTYGTASGTLLDKSTLRNILVNSVSDTRDGAMYLIDSNLVITGNSGVIAQITSTGTYSISFDVSDIAKNYVNAHIDINVIA